MIAGSPSVSGFPATGRAIGGGKSSSLPDGPAVRKTLLAGFLVLGLSAGGFGGWAAYAPLSSAAIANGAIVVDGSHKVIQHLDGGTIAALYVREGDHVRAGQLLMRLDDLEAKTLHDVLQGQYIALAAQEARLQAEQQMAETVVFPAILEKARDRPEVASILNRQIRIFESGRKALDGQIQVLRQRIAQLNAQIGALEAQISAGMDQLALVEEEIAGVQAMVEKGLERKPRLLSLRRTEAFLKGQQGEYENRVAQAKDSIAETELEILNVVSTRVERAATELGDVSTERAEVERRLVEAQVKRARHDVIAPMDGTVFNLRFHTLGGVVRPAEEILQIVPDSDTLVVEARVSPSDIDVVHQDLLARVVLTAFKRRNTPQLDGRVLQVSADAVEDERTGKSYFVARIEIDVEQLERLDGVSLYPGMPVEVFIQTSERTLLDYLMGPVQDSFRRAFREN